MPDLDDAYANAAHIPGAERFPPLWAEKAEAFRDTARADLGRHYGPGPREAFDLFLPDAAPLGTVIFIHGGYWRAFGRSDWSHLAAGPVARGWAVAMPSYDLCPTVRISDITRQIAAAVEAIAACTEGPIVLTGHSAGGHLVARMLAPGVLDSAVAGRIARVIPISPLSDLDPLRQTAMNDDFGLDAEEARAESPIHQPVPATPVTVWVGGDERPAFIDQARWLAEAWGCDCIVVPGRHHFDVIDALEDPGSDLAAALIGERT